MEEKKLTDEELVNIYANCINGSNVSCRDCPLKQIGCENIEKRVVDFMHRLQSENAEYRQKIEDGELVSKDWHDEQVGHAELVIAEQKAEIEQLTKKDKKNVDIIHTAMNDYVKLQKQVDDYEKALNYFEERDIFCEDCKSQAVKDTAEQFAEMAKSKRKYLTTKSYNTVDVVFVKDIDEICKEITEGNNADG